MKDMGGLLKATVPVVLGVLLAGFLMNKFYDTDIIKECSDGFDM